MKQRKTNDLNVEELNAKIEAQMRNETDKFIRHFRRLQAQFTGLEITALPMDFDTSMHLKLNDGTFSNINLETLYFSYQANFNKK